MTAAAKRLTPLDAYQRKLFLFLGVATFFEGYDFLALTQVLPNVRAEFALDETSAGTMVSVIKLGTVIAFLLVRRADRWGRRSVLTITIVGYTVFTFLTGLSPGVISFAIFQLIANMFLIAEWAVSMVYAAEEFPTDRRGMVIGVIQACSSLGAIACAGVVPFLLGTPYGWRTVYFVGIVPLIILAVMRRGLRESSRFDPQAAATSRSFFHIWRTPHKKRLLQVGAIWAFTYLCTNNAVTFWKEFAIGERGLSDGQVGLAISVAAVGAMPLVFFAGKLLDLIGRRRGAVVIFGVAIAGVLACYGLHGQWPLTIALLFGIVGTSAVLPVLNAFTAELFPTEVRGDAFAWSNNLLGRIGYVAGPTVVGVVAKTHGWGVGVQVTSLGLVIALVLILSWLPETNKKDLDETAAM